MTLDRAIEIAREAHAGQIDKGGNPYIEHCLRVMEAVESREEKIVAILHDLIEECPAWTYRRLEAEHASSPIVRAIANLTRGRHQSYRAYIGQIATEDLSTVVKIADLKDNMDLSRIPNPTEADLDRIKKYRINLAFLEQKP